MEELKEKIARAIYENRNGSGAKPWSIQTSPHKLPYFGDVGAALRAIEEAGFAVVPKEPTSYMIAAAAQKPGQQTYGDVWHLMMAQAVAGMNLEEPRG